MANTLQNDTRAPRKKKVVEIVETHTSPYTDAHALAALQCMGAIWRTLQEQKTDTAEADTIEPPD